MQFLFHNTILFQYPHQICGYFFSFFLQGLISTDIFTQILEREKRNKDARIRLRYRMDAYIQQIGLGSSDKIQYCMFPLSEIVNLPKLQKQTKQHAFGIVSLFIAPFWKVDALGMLQKD